MDKYYSHNNGEPQLLPAMIRQNINPKVCPILNTEGMSDQDLSLYGYIPCPDYVPPKDIGFKNRVIKSLEISNKLQHEPWLAEELDRDPEVLSAVMASHADYIPGSYIGGQQPSSIRQALQGLIDTELNKRSGDAQKTLARAGFAVSLAGFILAAVQMCVAIHPLKVADPVFNAYNPNIKASSQLAEASTQNVTAVNPLCSQTLQRYLLFPVP